ncbi:MAG: hypothetical protein L3K19_09680 [Thermoplasmata archaeon]|nr:hypothetical protein [Thermoplasmata archaeon]
MSDITAFDDKCPDCLRNTTACEWHLYIARFRGLLAFLPGVAEGKP